MTWIDYSNPVGAFSVKLPEQPNEITKEVYVPVKDAKQKFILKLYVSADSVNGKTYLVRYNNYPDGYYLKDKEAVFDHLITEFKGKAEFVKNPIKIWRNGMEGREAIVSMRGGYYMILRVFAKGNRIYVLLEESGKDEISNLDKPDTFFDSFKILPTIEPKYYSYKNDSANFSVQMVTTPIIKPDTTITATSYLSNIVIAYATNPNSGGLYDFEYSKISPYYRIENTDSLYSESLRSLTKYDDSVLSKKTLMVNGVKAAEITLLNKTVNSERRIRLIQGGDYLYFLICYADSDEFKSKTYDNFSNSFVKIKTLPSTLDLASSKAEKIYNDLASVDTVIYKNALGALSYYKFKKDELPYVYKALQRSYPDDTTEDGTRYKLLEKLATVNVDSTAYFLTGLYHSSGLNDYLKSEILSVIPKLDKKEGYNIYMKLLLNDPPLKATNLYSAFYPLTDSVEFAAAHFNELLPFMKYENMRRRVLNVAKEIANQKNEADTKMISADYPKLTEYAIKDIDNYIAHKNDSNSEWGYYMYSYTQLAEKIKNANINAPITSHYLKDDPKGLYAPDAIEARIYNNLPNSQPLLNKYLDSLGTRYDIMDAYNDMNQLSKVPLKYKQPAEYAKLCLYQYAATDDDNEDYGSPEKMVLLGTILNKGSEYYVFKFREPERDDTNYLIGITGPYKPGSTKLNFKRYYAYSDYSVVKTNWRKQAMALIKPLIDSYKQ